MKLLRAVHEGEGWHFSQVDLDQFGVHFLHFGFVGFSRDGLDQGIDLLVLVLTPVAVPVARHAHPFRAEQVADASPRHGRASAGAPHHEDVIASGQWCIRLGHDSLVDRPFGVVGRDLDTDLFAGGSHDFDCRLPVGPTVRAGRDVAQFLAVVFTPAIAIGVFHPGFIQQFLGAFIVLASPLQVLDGSLVIQGLLTGGRVHQRARHLGEGRRLVGHRVGNDGVIVNRDSNRLADRNQFQTRGFHVVEGGWEAGADAIGGLGQVGRDRQIVLQPQILDIGVELLTDIHFTGLQSGEAGRVVLEDGVRHVFRSGQLAPHRGILTPIIVIAD